MPSSRPQGGVSRHKHERPGTLRCRGVGALGVLSSGLLCLGLELRCDVLLDVGLAEGRLPADPGLAVGDLGDDREVRRLEGQDARIEVGQVYTATLDQDLGLGVGGAALEDDLLDAVVGTRRVLVLVALGADRLPVRGVVLHHRVEDRHRGARHHAGGAGIDAQGVVGRAQRRAEVGLHRRRALDELVDQLVLAVVAAFLEQQDRLRRGAAAGHRLVAAGHRAGVVALVAEDRTRIGGVGAGSGLTLLGTVAELAVAAARSVRFVDVGRTAADDAVADFLGIAGLGRSAAGGAGVARVVGACARAVAQIGGADLTIVGAGGAGGYEAVGRAGLVRIAGALLGDVALAGGGATLHPGVARRVVGRAGLARIAGAGLAQIAGVARRAEAADHTGIARRVVGRTGLSGYARAGLIFVAGIAGAVAADRTVAADRVGRAAAARAGLVRIAGVARARPAERAVRIDRQTVVRALVARLGAVRVAVCSRTGIAGVCAAGTATAVVGAVAEQTVGAAGAVRVGAQTVVGALVARFGAVAVAVRSGAGIAYMRRAGAAAAGVGAVAEQAVRTRRAVRIGRRAVVGRLVARLRAVAVAVRSRTRIAGVHARSRRRHRCRRRCRTPRRCRGPSCWDAGRRSRRRCTGRRYRRCRRQSTPCPPSCRCSWSCSTNPPCR